MNFPWLAGSEMNMGMDEVVKASLRRIPSVDSLLADPQWDRYRADLGTKVVAEVVREAVDALRGQVVDGVTQGLTDAGWRDTIAAEAVRRLEGISMSSYGRAINATGIILHTGLGRAVLAAKALAQIQGTLQGYSLLQVDRETGKRSRRDEQIERLLQRLTGAEAATVVNNNAAATAIVLNTVAKGREVIVSRGQLVEIGGSFRLPEVMAFSGARLVEVGTTNKTHPRDYEQAITENTVAILRVHPSNYRILGFASEVAAEEMAAIAHDHNLVFIDDVGAGALMDFSQFGFEPEPTLQESVGNGADIVTSSADKLIGASQGGIILGKKRWIEAIRKNPFARILRVGKLTLGVLEATLKLFLDQAVALREVPALEMMQRTGDELRGRAERLASDLRDRSVGVEVTTVSGFSEMGSGSLPTQGLATTLVAIAPGQIGADTVAKRLRQHDPPIFARIQEDRVLIDPRTLLDGDERILVEAVAEALGRAG